MSSRAGGTIAGGMFGGLPGATFGALGGSVPGVSNMSRLGLGASPIMGSAGFDPNDLENFASTEKGRSIGQDKIRALKDAGFNGQDYYSGRGTGETNINDQVGPYLEWLKSQARLKKDQASYAALVKDQPGRDQTILGGPERTLLGS